MDFSKIRFFLTVAVFCSFQLLGEAARCYVCDSQRNPNCGDPFSPFAVVQVDCDRAMNSPIMLRSNMCMKVTTRLPDGTYRVRRDCSQQNYNNQPMLDGGSQCLTQPNGEFICHCFGDSCNGAVLPASSVAFALLTSLIVMVFSLFRS